MAFYLQTDTFLAAGETCVIRTVAYTDDGNLSVIIERHEPNKPITVIGQSIVQLPAAPLEVRAEPALPPAAEPPKASGNGNGKKPVPKEVSGPVGQ